MTTHTTPIDLRPYHGRGVEAVIGEHLTTTEIGKFSVSKSGSVFFCNNSRGSGINSEDIEKFGYSRGWIVQSPNERVWDSTQLKSITLLDEPKSINPEWDWKDGEIVRSTVDDHEYEMNVFGEIVIPIDVTLNKADDNSTFKEAYDCGFRKLPPPPSRKLVEITEEVFDKTNLINQRVEFLHEDYTVSGMRLASGKRLLSLIGIQAEININECKLIEE